MEIASNHRQYCRSLGGRSLEPILALACFSAERFKSQLYCVVYALGGALGKKLIDDHGEVVGAAAVCRSVAADLPVVLARLLGSDGS